MSIWQRLKTRLLGAGNGGRFCSVFCPGCRVDLNAAASAATCTDTDLVRFTCGNCGTRSAWDFDAPVPILVSKGSKP